MKLNKLYSLSKIEIEDSILKKVQTALEKFIYWLNFYGETSFDHQSYYAGPIGRLAKIIYYKKPAFGIFAVFPMVFSEAFFPLGRKFFWKKIRFPIADAHYAMGFLFLFNIFGNHSYYERAIHFLNILKSTRCLGFDHYCWGYPFHWVTKNGTIRAGTPLITTTPYIYEAFSLVHEIDGEDCWLEVMHSIAEHAFKDIKDFYYGPKSYTCGYTPYDDKGGVINASAYRAFLLTKASKDFSNDKYWQIAEKNLNFVLQTQKSVGSWPYAIDGERDFIDHFHTCFVLKALAKIEHLTGHKGCTKAIEKGVDYYLKNLFDEEGLPKPFARAPRLTVYRSELYDYAECINLGVLLHGRFQEMDSLVGHVIDDLLKRWQKPDGSFRSRKLFFGWDNVPMHRWGQSQIFRSLCFLLYENSKLKAQNPKQ